MRPLNKMELESVIRANLRRLNKLDPREKTKIAICKENLRKAWKMIERR